MWRTKIRETGDAWADYCYYDIGIRSTSEVARFVLELGETGLGSFEVKDLKPIPFWRDEALNPARYLIGLRQVGTDSFDGVFHIGSGSVMNVLLDWQFLDAEKAKDLRKEKCALRIELPAGFEALGGSAVVKGSERRGAMADGGTFYEWRPNNEKCPVARKWKNYFRPAVLISTALPPGSCPGSARISALYDGRIVSKTVEMPLAVVEPVVAKAVPKHYFIGINTGSENEYGRELCTRYADSLVASGIRATDCVREPFATVMQERGCFFKAAGVYFLSNGFLINSHPPRPQLRPVDQRFVADDPGYKPELMAKASCPMAVYNEDSYFRDIVVPGLDMMKFVGGSGYRTMLCNWEPNDFFNHGCMCARCRAEFVRWSGIPETDVAAGWPENVRIGGLYREQAARFRAWQHGRLMKTLNRCITEALGPGNEGFCPMLAWTAATGQMREAPGAEEIASEEYMGDLKWFNPWGPYVWWDAHVPYFHEKRYAVAEWAAAKVIRERTDSIYTNHVKLIAFPHGKQGTSWEVQPEWLEMCLDSYFFNRWEGSFIYYFPRGYDARWFRSVARAAERAANYEDYVRDGTVADKFVSLEPVPEYAAPCHMVTAYLPQTTNISPLCSAAFDRDGSRIVAVINFWEDAEAFFTLRCRGLAAGNYTVISDRRTLWTKDDGTATYSAAELEKGVFVVLGKARTKVFEIRPSGMGAAADAVEKMDAADVRRLYEELRPALRREADRDHAEETGRTILNPDGTPLI